MRNDAHTVPALNNRLFCASYPMRNLFPGQEPLCRSAAILAAFLLILAGWKPTFHQGTIGSDDPVRALKHFVH